ncbi:MAG TPA: prephenate dehydrogenase/arogenate dehydrogenase family protein [Thermomicrobiales bacterium]|nr:prephenate dehydrogenase/arogenate dehydrogenase family protein [Thermomicrobiales bacterium]
MQRITIIGLGLIGGSIGLGLRQWAEANRASGKPALEVTGFDTDLDHQSYAQKIKAIDHGAWDLAKAVAGADVVVVATPVVAMRETFETIAPQLRPGATVVDVGSTKERVLEWANALLPRTVSFVGSHPMAGTTDSIEGASAELFKGATWCVSPSVHASEDAIRNVLGMIAALGAEPYFVDPVEHDAYVASVSHLPFIISSALMTTVSSDPSWRDMRTLTASGFRDVSRLAAGSPAMHRDILLTNRDAVVRRLDAYIASLQAFRETLTQDDAAAGPALFQFFDRARDARADWSTQTTREGELLQDTAAEFSSEGFGDHITRMFLGGLGRKRRPSAQTAKTNGSKPSEDQQPST